MDPKQHEVVASPKASGDATYGHVLSGIETTIGTLRSLSRDYIRDFPEYGFRAVVHRNRTLSLLCLKTERYFAVDHVPFAAMQPLVEFLNAPFAEAATKLTTVKPRTADVTADVSKERVEQLQRQYQRWTSNQSSAQNITKVAVADRCTMEKWTYVVSLDTDAKEQVTFYEALGIYLRQLDKPDREFRDARANLKRAYTTQTAVTVKGKPDGDGLLVPPDRYADDQTFLCQQCFKPYRYGNSKKDYSATWGTWNKPNVRGDEYHPAMFCSLVHEDTYLVANDRKYPPVTAEIPLGKPETCNLGGIDVKSVGQLSGIDEIARSLGMEPVGEPIVIQDTIVQDVRKRNDIGDLR